MYYWLQLLNMAIVRYNSCGINKYSKSFCFIC